MVGRFLLYGVKTMMAVFYLLYNQVSDHHGSGYVVRNLSTVLERRVYKTRISYGEVRLKIT